jgi:hypothetical protein
MSFPKIRVLTGGSKMPSILEKEFEFYLENQTELVKKYQGKFLVIKDRTVIGAFDTEIEAIESASSQHELGTFLVQICEPGPESYTQTFHSRVAFA